VTCARHLLLPASDAPPAAETSEREDVPRWHEAANGAERHVAAFILPPLTPAA